MRWMGGLYERCVFPWINDTFTGLPAVERARAETLGAARGRVVEIGFGTGLNLPHYRSTVGRLVGVEPNRGMQGRAAPRIAASAFPVQVVAGVAEALPLADAAFDTAVTVLTLCSVSDPGRSLLELRRVLREDGRLLVMEHGLAQDPGVATWQRRLNPIGRIVACGCHLTRPMRTLVEAHGFRFETVQTYYLPGAPRTHGWLTVGVAVRG